MKTMRPFQKNQWIQSSIPDGGLKKKGRGVVLCRERERRENWEKGLASWVCNIGSSSTRTERNGLWKDYIKIGFN